jgi:TetR/AcrR family transcriptional regulator, transcriptional repressor of bet genes
VTPRVGVTPVRRQAIATATVRCLARDGHAGLTMKKLAREARVSQGILHYYFRDKREILTAALRAVTADLDRRVAVAQARSGREPHARLRALVRACLETARDDRATWSVFVQYWGAMLHDPELRAINADVYQRARGHIAALLTDGVSAGTFRKVDAPEAASVVLALVDGVSLQLTFEPALFTIERAARFCEQALRRYLDP